jgi:hypothetical protein
MCLGWMLPWKIGWGEGGSTGVDPEADTGCDVERDEDKEGSVVAASCVTQTLAHWQQGAVQAAAERIEDYRVCVAVVLVMARN